MVPRSGKSAIFALVLRRIYKLIRLVIVMALLLVVQCLLHFMWGFRFLPCRIMRAMRLADGYPTCSEPT